jgi:hypothetical protein
MLLDPFLEAFRPATQITYSEHDLVWMCGGPGDNPLELRQIVPKGGDLRKLFFDDLNVSHEPNAITS